MRLLNLRYTFLFFLVIAFAGCKKFVEQGDVNINPNLPSTTTLKSLVPALIEATANNHYVAGYNVTLFSQQMGSYVSGPSNADRYIDVRSDAMVSLYSTAMTNARILIDLAKDQNAPYYSAIGKILMVTNLLMATDIYGDVPFNEAFKAPAIIYPVYDKQEDLYPLMHKYLDEAIAESASTTPGTLVPGGEDFTFAGSMAAWRQTAYFLKARLYIHTTKKGAVAAANNALTAIANGYTTTSADYQLIYNSRNKNPWATNIGLKYATGNLFIAPSKRFTDAMNGTSYPGLVDPRISLFMDKGTAVNYVGLANGGGNSTGNTVNLTINTFFAKETSPLIMGSVAEQKFIEAEARFLANGGTATSVGGTQAAYDAYIAGITSNMKKVGVAQPAIDAYLLSPLVAVGVAGLKMEHIMKEKQIALYLNPEAWADVRRYDYNPQVFIGMTLPLNQGDDIKGQFIRRSLIPVDELSRNPNAAKAIKLMSDKVWWDQ